MSRIPRAGTLLALALIAVLALAVPAGAKKKPPHGHGRGAHHRVAQAKFKGWAKHAKVKRAKGDPDADSLSNWGEFRSHTKPKRADSDGDRIGDASEDYDHDGLDNGSEEDAGTDPGVKDTDHDGVTDGSEDADHDGLSNAAEDRAGTNPRKRDSDDDGSRDGDEISGAVVAYDGAMLTLRLLNGKLLSAAVDADTEFSCWDRDGASNPDPSGDDGADDPVDDGSGGSAGEDADPGDALSQDDGGSGDDCTDGQLEPGAVVHSAEVENGVFVDIDLITSGSQRTPRSP